MNEIVSKRKIVSRSSFIFTSLAYLTITRTSVPKRINFENHSIPLFNSALNVSRPSFFNLRVTVCDQLVTNGTFLSGLDRRP